jgi:hypothetical protein
MLKSYYMWEAGNLLVVDGLIVIWFAYLLKTELATLRVASSLTCPQKSGQEEF